MLSAAEHVQAAAPQGIGPKSALMEYAALARGLATNRWNRKEVLIEPPGDAAPLFFHEMNGPRSSISGKLYCLEKTVARDLLRRAGLNVATSRAFDPSDVRDGLRWAESLGYPVVVKPASEGSGRGVTANIQTPEAFATAWRRARTTHQGLRVSVTFARSVREATAPRRAQSWPARVTAYTNAIRSAGAMAWDRRWTRVLVEQHFDGFDFRFFVVGDEVVSVTQRKPANVVGDGGATVLELIERKNAIRAENPYLCNYPIPTRLGSLDVLATAGFTLSHVPDAGELVVLRSASNFSAGGDSIDLTDEAHPDFIDIAVSAVHAIPGVEYAGVDIITPDITASPTDVNHIVSEVEYSPGPSPVFPLVGTGRDMAGAVLDFYLEQHPGPAGRGQDAGRAD